MVKVQQNFHVQGHLSENFLQFIEKRSEIYNISKSYLKVLSSGN
jgi:hypothetical protein